MENIVQHWQAWVAATVFIIVIGLIMTEWIHMTVVALLGSLLLVFLNIMTLSEAVGYISSSYATLALFLGVMVVVRTFEPTRIFDYLATQMVRWAKGRGNRLLLAIVAVTTPICSVLPNATTVMLLAPLIPPMASEIGVDFVPLLILLVLVANSSGLITLVGDPATFIVGTSVNLSFTDYLSRLSLGGLLAVITVVFLLPILFPRTWRKQLENSEGLPLPAINHPRILTLGALIVLGMLILFVVGESLPVPVSPAAVALLGAALILLLADRSKIESVPHILRDVDWSTLLFFMCIFVLIGGLQKTNVISGLSDLLVIWLGTNIFLGCVVVIFLCGILSSVIPNIPLVIAMVPLLKQYVVNVGLAGSEILTPDYSGQLPDAVLPLFYAMMFGVTLGGNGTLVGASANIVAAGISEQHGQRISFITFLRYGMPVMASQLVVSLGYVIVRFLL